jgi:hypothetical protein
MALLLSAGVNLRVTFPLKTALLTHLRVIPCLLPALLAQLGVLAFTPLSAGD